MLYAFPILIAAMLAYMFWHAGYSMRRDRILAQRSVRRLPSTAARIRHRRSEPTGLR
jgi:hypothetical protein